MVSHYENALKLERRARKASSHGFKDAFKIYEEAGDEWFLSTKKPSIYSIEDTLRCAKRDYRFAVKEAESAIEKNRLIKKISSIEAKLATNKPLKGMYGRLSLATSSILTLALALLFVSFNLTGNAVAGITPDNFKWIGLCFFVCGLVFAFFYLKKKQMSNSK